VGAYVSTGVHYREDDRCKAAQVVADNPPAYTVFDLVVTEVDVLGAVVQIGIRGVELDTADPPATNGKYHPVCGADVEGF
jgi:hypothetical protein